MQRELNNSARKIRLAALEVTFQQLQHAFQERSSSVVTLRLNDFREQNAESRPASLGLGVSGMVDGQLCGGQQLLCLNAAGFKSWKRQRGLSDADCQ